MELRPRRDAFLPSLRFAAPPCRADDNSHNVSPICCPHPLDGRRRTTHGLSAEDLQRTGPETTRVNRADLDAILRPTHTAQQQPDKQPHTGDPYATTVAHVGQQRHTDASQNFDPNANGTLHSSNSDMQSGQSFQQMPDAASADAEEELTITVARPQQSATSFDPHFTGTPPPVAVTSLATDVQDDEDVQPARARQYQRNPLNLTPPTGGMSPPQVASYSCLLPPVPSGSASAIFDAKLHRMRTATPTCGPPMQSNFLKRN